jgi:N-acetylglucosaminyldiphosphoundecaprenol N-acetyl-beta-D-mannosaminyltransferase
VASLPVFHLLGRPYYQGGEAALLAWLGAAPKSGRAVHVANVHSVVTGLWDPELARSQAGAALSLPDGRPLSLAGKLLGCWEARQQRGPDLLLASARKHGGLRHYFLGGEAGVAQAVAEQLRRQARGLRVAGVESPPFRELSAAEVRALAGRLRR